MKRPMKPYCSIVSNSFYIDKEKRFEIGHDEYQFILRIGSGTYYYFKHITDLLLRLFDLKLVDISELEIKAVFDAIKSARNDIVKFSKVIDKELTSKILKERKNK